MRGTGFGADFGAGFGANFGASFGAEFGTGIGAGFGSGCGGICNDVGVGLVVVAAQWVSSLRHVGVACWAVVSAGATCLAVVTAAATCLAAVTVAATCLTAPGMGDGSTSLISSTPSARTSPPSWLRRLRNGVGDKCVLGANRDVGAAVVCAAALVMVW